MGVPHQPCLLKYGIATAFSILTLTPCVQQVYRVLRWFRWPSLVVVLLLLMLAVHKRDRLREKLQARISDRLRGPSRTSSAASLRPKGFRRSASNVSQQSGVSSQCTLNRTFSRENVSQQLDEEHGLIGLEHGLKARINPKVTVTGIENLTLISAQRKAELWWQQDDFDKFLKVRVQIAKAYKAAAKLLTLDIMQVTSIGAHGDAAYRSMIELKPELADESRRGLGLGRKKQRALNRETFVDRVLEEQGRQRKEFAAATAGGQAYGAGKEFELDVESLRIVATTISEPDIKYAHRLANLYYAQWLAVAATEDDAYRQVRQLGSTTIGLGSTCTLSNMGASPSPLQPPDTLPGHSPHSPEATPEPSEPEVSEPEEPEEPQENSVETFETNELDIDEVETPHQLFSKGYGLSRDQLQQAGLCATGFAMQKWQQRQRINKYTKHQDEEPDTTAGETDEEQPQDPLTSLERKAFVEQYKEWRKGAAVRVNQGMTICEANFYGTRKEYGYWRAWAKKPSGFDSSRASPASSPLAGQVGLGQGRASGGATASSSVPSRSAFGIP